MSREEGKIALARIATTVGCIIAIIVFCGIVGTAFEAQRVYSKAMDHFTRIDKRVVSTSVHSDGIVCVTYFDPVGKPTVVTECPVPTSIPQKVDK